MATLSPDQLQEFNQATGQWARATRRRLKLQLASQGLEDTIRANGRQSLMKSLRSRTYKKQGRTEKVQFIFAVHGWFFQRGVGRNVPLSRVSSSSRKARPWLHVVDSELEQFADRIAEIYGNELVEVLDVLRSIERTSGKTSGDTQLTNV